MCVKGISAQDMGYANNDCIGIRLRRTPTVCIFRPAWALGKPFYDRILRDLSAMS